MSNEIPLMVTRTQWAAGQGFFHSCALHSYGKPFVYVFDCGSKNNAATGFPDTVSTIDQEVEQFATSLDHRWPEWPEWLESLEWPELPVWPELLEVLESAERTELQEWQKWQIYKYVKFCRDSTKYKNLFEARCRFAPTFMGVPFKTKTKPSSNIPQPKKPTIHIVYISHFDDDHINGLKHLLNKTDIKEVSIPYATPTERFIYLLNSTSDEHGELQTTDLLNISEFTIDFIANPSTAVARESESTTVRESDNENSEHTTAIYTINNAQTGTYDLSSTRPQTTPTTPIWTLFTHTLRGNAREIEDYFEMALLEAIRKHIDSNQNTVEDILPIDKQEVPNEIPQEEEPIKHINFNDPTTLRKLLSSQYIGAVKEAYKAVLAPSQNLNQTSLILYSGPVKENETTTTFYAYWRGNESTQHHHSSYTLNLTSNSNACGWIGCGDAPIGRKYQYLEDFTRTFSSFKRMTSTFAPPHHGSEKDWHDDLLTGFGPSEKDAPICVFSANSLRWGHPSTKAILSANSVGSPTIVVTKDIRSRFTETIAVIVRID